MLKTKEFATFLSANNTILSIINRRIVGQNVGQSKKRCWGNPCAVTVILTHIENTKWVNHSEHVTIRAEKPPFLAVFLFSGPRWETRTPDILLPKQARYQLR